MIKSCTGKWWQFCRKVFRLYPGSDKICTKHVIWVLPASDQIFVGKCLEFTQEVKRFVLSTWSEFYQQMIRFLPASDQTFVVKCLDFTQEVMRFVLNTWSEFYQQVIRFFCRKVFRLYPGSEEICTEHVIWVLPANDQIFARKWSEFYQ